MLTIFNRRELIVTFSMQEQSRVRAILSSARIAYHIRASARSGGINQSERLRSGSCGVNPELYYEYRVYVHRADFERADYLIHRDSLEVGG